MDSYLLNWSGLGNCSTWLGLGKYGVGLKKILSQRWKHVWKDKFSHVQVFPGFSFR